MTPKKGGLIEAALAKRYDAGCRDCAGLVRIRRGFYGCIPHDKFIPYAFDGNRKVMLFKRSTDCTEWTPKDQRHR